VLKETKKVTLTPTGDSTAATASLPKSALGSIVAPPLRLRGLSLAGWLTRITKSKDSAVRSAPSPASMRETFSAAIPVTTHNASDYNWSGFSCPYCNASGLVRCGAGHLTCDGTIELKKGRRFHQCFCGAAGFITGVIETFENKRSSVEGKRDGTKSATANSQAINGSPEPTVLLTHASGNSNAEGSLIKCYETSPPLQNSCDPL